MFVSKVLQLGSKITVLPVIHGSGDFAIEVRRLMLNHQFDHLAVPLPPSFQSEVESGTEQLPAVSAVVQPTSRLDFDEDDEADINGAATYVPIDPCQPVITALRIAAQEHIPRSFIDIEDDDYQPAADTLPDAYALKQVTVERFAAAVLPALAPPHEGSQTTRIHWMANELHRLTKSYDSILLVCGMREWPWIRDAFQTVVDRPPAPLQPSHPARIYSVQPESLLFMLGELPFITGLYEQARRNLDDDENLSIDGVKTLMLASRDRYQQEFGTRARPITPQLLSVCLKYIRNLSLVERRFTPDLYTLVLAARQTAGDQYAIHLAETARDYPFDTTTGTPTVQFGVDRIRLPDGDVVSAVSRLPGHPMVWRSCQLKARPDKHKKVEWKKSWNPFGQCSWPPEDVAIERFRTHVKDVALTLLGNDLARTEKFTSSIKDGLDIRETLRNWHTGELYVREYPPARGDLDCVVMLFDSPADPRDYPWRITWQAEHHDESTLSLFATDFNQEHIGPGIAVARYGGCMFLFPPRPVPDVFRDPQFDFTDTLEERLIAAALHYSNESHIALLSHLAPGAGWRRLAKRSGKKIIHVPLNRFGSATVDRLKTVHVLNGQQVRSYAAQFIREP
ncbi:MAG: hypothetical protein MK102_12920 [Fuerstiella sp.]|nr:hypothetical protein [Fuerstiella sp.]